MVPRPRGARGGSRLNKWFVFNGLEGAAETASPQESSPSKQMIEKHGVI